MNCLTGTDAIRTATPGGAADTLAELARGVVFERAARGGRRGGRILYVHGRAMPGYFRGGGLFYELFTWGARHVARNMISEKFIRAIRPTSLSM